MCIISAEETEISEPTILVYIPKTFHYGMSPEDLYLNTRRAWSTRSLKKEYRDAKYAMTIYACVIQEVYEIAGWFQEDTSTQLFFTRVKVHREKIGLNSLDGLPVKSVNL